MKAKELIALLQVNPEAEVNVTIMEDRDTPYGVKYDYSDSQELSGITYDKTFGYTLHGEVTE